MTQHGPNEALSPNFMMMGLLVTSENANTQTNRHTRFMFYEYRQTEMETIQSPNTETNDRELRIHHYNTKDHAVNALKTTPRFTDNFRFFRRQDLPLLTKPTIPEPKLSHWFSYVPTRFRISQVTWQRAKSGDLCHNPPNLDSSEEAAKWPHQRQQMVPRWLFGRGGDNRGGWLTWWNTRFSFLF